MWGEPGGVFSGEGAAQLKTMRSKLIRIMLVISGLTGIATFGTVAMMSVQTSSRHLDAIQKHIEEGIASKGRVLTHNHALALRSLILDNAFLDMQRLVERAVHEDEDLVYGVFVSAEREALAWSRRGAPSRDGAPSADEAWTGLGLPRDEALVDRETVQRKVRLGEDLLEVAVPVTSDEGETLGTIRYGLSTARMHEALARAQAERNTDLLKSVSWIALLVSVTTLVGLVLSRIQAFRITRPVGDLTQAARDLAAGNRSVRVNIVSGDELELLGSSFNDMVEELGLSYENLEELNHTLEHKVEARTAEIALRNRDMRLVLDNVDQAFLTLAPDGRVTGGRSRVAGEWFGECQDGADFSEYIRGTSEGFGAAFHFGWSQVVDGFLPLALAIDQLPKQLTANQRIWSFQYLPFLDADELAGMLVVAAEITERLTREREEAEQRELMQSFAKLMLDKNGFMSFLREPDDMVQSICSHALDADPVHLRRTLHTLKGNAAAMGFSLVSALCHTIEEQTASGEPAEPASIVALSERWRLINQHVVQFMPSTAERTIEVPATEYAALIARLSADEPQAEALNQVLAWGLEPAARPLERLAKQGQTLARRLGKADIETVVRAGSVRLDAGVWRRFFSELVHVVRNAVDHGIEEPAERERRGKPPNGRLIIGVRRSPTELTFEVADDGRGIDWEAMRAKAKERGLPHTTRAELLAVLCHDGVTSRTEVTATSGRGVGMAAFKQCVEQMQGRLDVTSSELGTTWSMTFPIAAADRTSHSGSVPPPGSKPRGMSPLAAAQASVVENSRAAGESERPRLQINASSR